MKKVLFCFWIVLVCFGGLLQAGAVAPSESSDLQDVYADAVENSGLGALEESLPEETRALLSEYGVDLWDADLSVSGDGMLQIVGRIVTQQGKAPLQALAAGMAMLLLAGLGTNLLTGGQQNRMLGYVTVLAVMTGLTPLLQTVSDTSTALSGTGTFLYSFVPVYAGILLAGGGTALAGSFSTLLLLASQAVNTVLVGLAVPVVTLFLALSLAAAVTSFRLEGFLAGVQKALVWVMSLTLTLFLGVLGVQTTISAAADSLSVKTARFAAGSFLPVVGSMAGDAIGTVTACLGLLRASAGAYGVLALVFLLLPVFLQLVLWRGVLFLLEVLAGLCSVGAADKVYRAAGQALNLLLGILIWTAFLFIISLTVVVLAGGQISS